MWGGESSRPHVDQNRSDTPTQLMREHVDGRRSAVVDSFRRIGTSLRGASRMEMDGRGHAFPPEGMCGLHRVKVADDADGFAATQMKQASMTSSENGLTNGMKRHHRWLAVSGVNR